MHPFQVNILSIQWYRTKLHGIVPKMNYFKPIILKFETFIYNSNGKTIHNFCKHGGNALPVEEKKLPLVFSEKTA